jgi:2-desacetyl-2-hydroxyethyl bacteriochlorophyllide A dehydrogenase
VAGGGIEFVKALVYDGPRTITWRDHPEPVLQPGDVLVRVHAVGICGSDVHGYAGESGRRAPGMVMGHEAAGEVVAVSAQIRAGWLGQRVVIQPIIACGTCDECRDGRPHRCRNRRFIGGTADGAMAEHVAVPAANLLPLPGALGAIEATLAEPLAVAIHAVRQAGDLTGRSVLVAGSGPIGMLTLVAARHAGARLVVMTDLTATRRAMAEALGADAAIDPVQVDLHSALRSAAGREEVDLAFDAVGIPATFDQAMVAVRPGGTVVAIGGWRTVPVDLSRLVTREIRVLGTFNYTPAEFAEAIGWLAEGRPDPARVVTDVREFSEAAAVFEALADGRLAGGKVVLVPPGRAA